MTFINSGCIHDADLTLVSILTFQGRGSQKTKNQSPDLDVWPWKSRSNIFLHDLSYLRLQTWYEVDLSVDFNIFKIEDIKIIKTNTWPYWLTLKLKVIHFFHMTLLISGCIACYLLDLGVESNILKVEDLRKSISGYLTLMFDLDFQGQTTFLQIYIIFKVSHYRYIIYFWFFEFFDLDYVKINTEIKSAACIQPEIMKVHLKVCLTLIFKVNYGSQVTYVSHIEIPNIWYVQIDTNIVSFSRIQSMINKGSQ